MAFFDLEGHELNTNEFVEYYSPSYFLGVEKRTGIRYSQGSRYVEDVVMDIMNSHFESRLDIVRALAWKMGRIKHRESQDDQRFIYTSDWEECEQINPMRYGRVLDLDTLSRYIINNIELLEDLADNSPNECLLLLRNCNYEGRNHNIRGIGTVYLITLLFFLSHGRYPIYDRFAMAALLAHERNLQPNNMHVVVNSMPGKWDASFATVCENEYQEYINRLEDLQFDYRHDRRLDRALWIYGHAF